MQIERIEARDINGEEMLARIRVCEDSLATVNHQKLSPFNQQEVFQRLDELEIRVRLDTCSGSLSVHLHLTSAVRQEAYAARTAECAAGKG